MDRYLCFTKKTCFAAPEKLTFQRSSCDSSQRRRSEPTTPYLKISFVLYKNFLYHFGESFVSLNNTPLINKI